MAARWLEVSLTVDPEVAEAVSEVLSRYAPEGVVIETTHIDPDAEGEGTPSGPVKVYAFLTIDEKIEETRQRLSESLWYLGRIRPVPEPAFRPIEDEDWSLAWRSRYQPTPLGQRLIVLPAWADVPTGGRIPVRIDPGMAFGTGTHPTTRLCLELLETCVRPGQPVLDIGSGSAILSIAAVLLGASQAVGVDIDPIALPSAQANVALNNAQERVWLGVGSVAEVQSGQTPLRRAPLVMANILAPVILRLLDAGLADLMEPGGELLLSGILEPQLTGQDGHVHLFDGLARHGLKVIERRQIDDWVALRVSR